MGIEGQDGVFRGFDHQRKFRDGGGRVPGDRRVAGRGGEGGGSRETAGGRDSWGRSRFLAVEQQHGQSSHAEGAVVLAVVVPKQHDVAIRFDHVPSLRVALPCVLREQRQPLPGLFDAQAAQQVDLGDLVGRLAFDHGDNPAEVGKKSHTG